MKTIFFTILLISSNAFAESIALSNKIRFFEKENFAAIVTTPMCDFINIDIQVQLPENTAAVQKVFEQKISCSEFNGKLQIFFHQKGTDKYLSQQILITTQQDDIAFCTSYFSLGAKFLIPGACVGSFNKKSIGISIFK